MLYQYIRYVELSAHSRSKCTMQMTLYRVASIASPCENFQDDIITASLLYRTQFRVQIQGLIFQSLMAKKLFKKEEGSFEIEQAISE